MKTSERHHGKRAINLLVGTMLAMACSLMAFEYTTVGTKAVALKGDLGESVDLDLPPIPTKPTSDKKKKPVRKAPGKAPVFKPIEGGTEPKKGDEMQPPIDIDCDTCDWWIDETGGLDSDVPFTIVENMPCLPGCEDLQTNEERMMCTDIKLKEAIAGQIHYPRKALINGISGTVYVQYVIDGHGRVTDVKLLRGLHPLLDEEALRVVRLIPNHIPGSQRGMEVPVSYNIPIDFVIK